MSETGEIEAKRALQMVRLVAITGVLYCAGVVTIAVYYRGYILGVFGLVFAVFFLYAHQYDLEGEQCTRTHGPTGLEKDGDDDSEQERIEKMRGE